MKDQTIEDIKQIKKKQSFRDDLSNTDIVPSPVDNKRKIQRDHHKPIDAEIPVELYLYLMSLLQLMK